MTSKKAHALLGPSSAERWLNCPPSARLSEKYPDTTSEFALEGTDAHELCELKLKKSLKQIRSSKVLKDPSGSLKYYNEDMERYTNEYVEYVLDIYNQCKKCCEDTDIIVEQELDFSNYVPEGFGTGDCIIVSDEKLIVIDFKYGKGVEVSAKDNPQMKLYGLGADNIYGSLYDYKNVELHIFQPRLANISSFNINLDELKNWGEETVKPLAEQAFNGEGEMKCGKWCRFCKAKKKCAKRFVTNAKFTEYDFKESPEVTDEQINEILPFMDELIAWAKDIKEYCLSEALVGKKWDGFKLVEGRSSRTITDADEVAKILTNAGFNPYEQKLLSITALGKLVGTKKLNELIGEFIVKPQGAPVLVDIDDKRPEFNSAKNDFKDFKEGE